MDDLARGLAAGEHEAFARLYDALADRLHHYAAILLGSRQDADDVLQETFIRLARHRRKLADVENLTAYVFQVARNEAMRLARRNARHRSHEAGLSVEELFVPAVESSASGRAEELLARGLARLNDKHREVIELKTFGRLTFAQIAEVLEIPPGTAASRYQAAVQRLRFLLRREMP